MTTFVLYRPQSDTFLSDVQDRSTDSFPAQVVKTILFTGNRQEAKEFQSWSDARAFWVDLTVNRVDLADELVVVRERITEYTHEMQPYGWVRMTDCRVEIREVSDYSKPVLEWDPKLCYTKNTYPHKRKAAFVVGTVADSRYCGALWGGVPVRTPDSSRYPVGTPYECEAKHEYDLAQGRTVDVAM